MSLVIHKSSAGSGKTYTLAKEYLKLALRAPDYYRKILAVTFTNRAAQEMKERVLQFLIDISQGRHELVGVFAAEFGKKEHEIIADAKACLTHLLHHYSFFSITTIDTFFHRVIRSFSREIGLKGSFRIELDVAKVVEVIISEMYEGVEENNELRKWLEDFSMDLMRSGKGYEIKTEVNSLAEHLFQEDFKRLPQAQFFDEKNKERLGLLKKKLFETKSAYEGYLKKIGMAFHEALSDAGLSIDDLKGKGRGAGNFFVKLLHVNYERLINASVQKARCNAEDWVTKTSPDKAQIMALAEARLMPLINDALDYIEEKEEKYHTSLVALEYVNTQGIISDLSRRLQAYKHQEEVIMISDLPDFLTQIIDDSGSPFIYEKVGTWYDHFLIDEFQDTSQFQWNNFRPLLEESLAHGHANILVGDAKQSIYGWRGGDPSLLLEKVKRDIPQTQFNTAKTTNWRSTPAVVQFNNLLFSTLPALLMESMDVAIEEGILADIQKTYDGVKQHVAEKNSHTEGLVEISFLEKTKDEDFKKEAMNRTIETIEALLSQGHALNEMAILVRTNSEAAEIVAHTLDYKRNTHSKIEIISAEGMLLKNASIVKLILAAFNYLISPEDDQARATLIHSYRSTVEKELFSSHQDFSNISESGLPEDFIKYQQHFLHLPILELMEVLVRTLKLHTLKNEWVYLQAFQDAVLDFSKNNRSDLLRFMEWWEDSGHKRSVQLTGALNAVEVITSHKSKGLEYPIVMIPFCNFTLDIKSAPVWYPSPFEEGTHLLVQYKQMLEETQFSDSYEKDRVKWYLENLNVLYVAFTRAERGLFVFCEKPSEKKKDKEIKMTNVSKLLWHFFTKHCPEGWDPDKKTFRVGALSVNKEEKKEETTQLDTYLSNKWSNKIKVRKSGATYLSEEAEASRQEGILLHQILSDIIHYKDSESVLNRYEQQMKITGDQRIRYASVLSGLWKQDRIRSWFDGSGQIKTEIVVLPKQGESKRLDRVILKGDRATVIDFKSGAPKSQDGHQLKNYTALLDEMGYQTEGYLLYLKTGEVVHG